jgi:hypothetical protein
MDLADVYRIFHPNSAQYTFFSAAYAENIFVHKTSLRKYRKIEIIPCTLSDHNALKLEQNNSRKHPNN